MKKRVVVTGVGICSPIGNNFETFKHHLSIGTSGIRFFPELKELGFSCQIGGKPDQSDISLDAYFSQAEQRGLKATGIIYAMIAAVEAATMAGIYPTEEVLWDLGVQFGTGTSGVDKFHEAFQKIDQKQVRRLGSSSVYQTMASGAAAMIAAKFGAGGRVAANSSACTTGVEALLLATEQIQSGQCKQVIAGSTSDSGPYIWGGFDALRILPNQFNEKPKLASKPLSEMACGFVPSSGAGAFILEEYEHALQRGVPILAEIIGGAMNCGGMRNGGSMTAANPEGIQRCIKDALKMADITPKEISSINGHLTATAKDSFEIEQWCMATGLREADFPYINSFKGQLGHGLAASGSMECVGVIGQLTENKIYGNVNGHPLHPEITKNVAAHKIPTTTKSILQNIIMKASFGFGDVNGCIIFKAYRK